MDDVAHLIDWLGGTSQVATICNVGLPAVSNWKLRNSIPARYWAAIVREAQERNIAAINYDLLSRIYANSHSVTETTDRQV
jgi:hypothetical protein